MRKFFMMFLIILLTLGLAACSNDNLQNEIKGEYKEMKQDEAKRNLDADKSIILVDVRTPQEYAESHIPGSILIPVDTIEQQVEDKLTDKSATIYVYCRSGNRSNTAARLMNELGYKNVYNIGGITTWPYDIEKGKK